ncbi:MAG: hypothetical protein WCJ30_13095 [Deltaproteobacteria bacterium]
MTRSARRFLETFLFAAAVAIGATGCASQVVPAWADGGADGTLATDARTDVPSTTECTAASQCAYGEIDHEIRVRADCPCLSGCEFVAMNVTTRLRRQMQYQSLCTPGVDGMGRPCGVDDCISPPPLECRMNVCVPPGG